MHRRPNLVLKQQGAPLPMNGNASTIAASSSKNGAESPPVEICFLAGMASSRSDILDELAETATSPSNNTTTPPKQR